MCKPSPTRCKYCSKVTCPAVEQARKMMREAGVPDFFSLMEQSLPGTSPIAPSKM